jgi:hypothetical protein
MIKYIGATAFFLLIGCVFYWTVVVSIANGYHKEANNIGMDGIVYKSGGLAHDSKEEYRKGDSCMAIFGYLHQKGDNTIKLIPKFLRP